MKNLVNGKMVHAVVAFLVVVLLASTGCGGEIPGDRPEPSNDTVESPDNTAESLKGYEEYPAFPDFGQFSGATLDLHDSVEGQTYYSYTVSSEDVYTEYAEICEAAGFDAEFLDHSDEDAPFRGFAFTDRETDEHVFTYYYPDYSRVVILFPGDPSGDSDESAGLPDSPSPSENGGVDYEGYEEYPAFPDFGKFSGITPDSHHIDENGRPIYTYLNPLPDTYEEYLELCKEAGFSAEEVDLENGYYTQFTGSGTDGEISMLVDFSIAPVFLVITLPAGSAG